MKIRAITSVMSAYCAQPVNKVEFARKKSSEVKEVPAEQKDTYAPNEQKATEQKYDLACRIAAYYKTQYENLLNQGECLA